MGEFPELQAEGVHGRALFILLVGDGTDDGRGLDVFLDFPEPDLLPVVLSEEQIEAWQASLPELPQVRRARLAAEYGIPDYDAGVLAADRAVADFYEAAARASGNPKAASNWVMTELLRRLSEGEAGLAAARITPAGLAELRRLLPDSYVTADPASVERARRANRQFHDVIIQASGNRLLGRLLQDIWNRLDPMTSYSRTLDSQQGAELRQQWGERDRLNHTALLQALQDGDAPRARRLETEYIQEVWSILENILETAYLPKE